MEVNRDPFWKDRNVFVTGCTGLLGSWMSAHLLAAGANVTGLVRDWVPKSELNRTLLAQEMNVVRGSVEDYALMERVISEYEIDSVFHLAAQTIVTIANRNPLSTFESNIKGTWNVLEACRRSPLVTRAVVASSDKAYGDQPKLPYDEKTPLQGRHPYDVSKSCADLLARSYYETYGSPVCVTRCGNFFGGGDLNFNRIVPGTIRSVLRSKRPVIRSDGKSVRDYIYIEDAVDGYLTLAEAMDDRKVHGEAYNLSTEAQFTVLELVNRILKLMGSDLKPRVLNEASNEILCQHLSARKARRMLGWKPKHTLDESLKKTIAWYAEFFSP
ncbi:MAG: GDP-mannose 4,6-dehydratase [Candidatus Altiarchaeota archaeon]